MLQGESALAFRDKVLWLWYRQSEVSQAKFKLDTERGPIGPCKHLVKEAQELLDELEKETPDPNRILNELADVYILTMDVLRRAGVKLGTKWDMHSLYAETATKIEVNNNRTHVVPDDPNAPIEHDRSMDWFGTGS